MLADKGGLALLSYTTNLMVVTVPTGAEVFTAHAVMPLRANAEAGHTLGDIHVAGGHTNTLDVKEPPRAVLADTPSSQGLVEVGSWPGEQAW